MYQIDVNGLAVDVVRKNIKNLHLAVYPPNGRVRIAVPLRVNDEAVRLAVIAKLGWIKRQQTRFQNQDRESQREYVSGESHYFLGNRYLLNVIQHHSAGRVVIRNKKTIDLYVRSNSDVFQRRRVMQEWYRAYLREAIPPLVAKWEKKVGVHISEWGIKHMKTRWGTCNIKAKRIWLNLELAKKSPRCLEYVVVHEMVHLLERLHNDNFHSLMNQFLPTWKQYRDELNHVPLAHEEWEY